MYGDGYVTPRSKEVDEDWHSSVLMPESLHVISEPVLNAVAPYIPSILYICNKLQTCKTYNHRFNFDGL